MKTKRFFIIGLLTALSEISFLFALCARTREPLLKASDEGLYSIGYLPNWAYGDYASLDYSALTHLNIAFCNPNTSGDLSAGINDNTLNGIITKAHENGVKVLASLGGAGYSTNYPDLISAANRSAFCIKIINYAKRYNFDGIDLDIEGEAAESFWGVNYEAWVAELRTLCNANDLILTSAVGQWYADKITTQTFTYFDFVTVMEYDLKANNYQNRINYYLNRGISAKKLVLGVPFYGYKNGTYISYKDILAENPDAWYTNNINGCTYHNMQDIADIAEMSKTCGGIMIWELSQDVQGRYSLLGAVKAVLFGNGFVFPEVEYPVTGVTVTPNKVPALQTREKVRLTATVSPPNATVKSVRWTCKNESIATVDSEGVVRGKKPGLVYITASTLNGAKTSRAEVTVVENPDNDITFADIYYIISVYSDKGLDVKDKSRNPGAGVQQWQVGSANNDNQRWIFEKASDSIYYIKSKLSNLYLTAMSVGNDGKIEQRNFTGNNNQQWKITEIESGIYTIINVFAQTAMDVAGPSVDNGAEIHLWQYLGGENQKWMFDVAEKASAGIQRQDLSDRKVTGIERFTIMGASALSCTQEIFIKRTSYEDGSVKVEKEKLFR